MAQTQDEIKTKYQNVLTTIQRLNGSLKNINMEGDRLLIRAEVANQDLENEVWNAIKAIDPAYSDLHAGIIINPALTPPPQTSRNQQQQRKYTVPPADSLSKIAQRFYGNANEYHRIFEASPAASRAPSPPSSTLPGRGHSGRTSRPCSVTQTRTSGPAS